MVPPVSVALPEVPEVNPCNSMGKKRGKTSRSQKKHVFLKAVYMHLLVRKRKFGAYVAYY